MGGGGRKTHPGKLPMVLTMEQANRLVSENLGLARKWASRQAPRVRTRRMGMDYDDLLSLGYLAMVRASRKYDPARNVKFSTYAWLQMDFALLGLIAAEITKRRGHPAPGRLGDAAGAETDDDSAVDLAIKTEETNQINLEIGKLDPRKAEVIRRRFFSGETLEAIARDLGITRERVRQIQNSAIHLLKKKG
jgi:RNA polymerase sigma factor (sigma-70 family)